MIVKNTNFFRNYKNYSDHYKSMTEVDIIRWLREHDIDNYHINADLTVDVFENVKLQNKGLVEIPIQFGFIKGSFNVSNNELTSLRGCPFFVSEDFYCNNNNLRNLKFCPAITERNFFCQNNKLRNLKSQGNYTVKQSFNCSNNSLVSFEGLQKTIEGNFFCDNNPLRSFTNCPEVKGEFSHNDIDFEQLSILPRKDFMYRNTIKVNLMKNVYIDNNYGYKSIRMEKVQEILALAHA